MTSANDAYQSRSVGMEEGASLGGYRGETSWMRAGCLPRNKHPESSAKGYTPRDSSAAPPGLQIKPDFSGASVNVDVHMGTNKLWEKSGKSECSAIKVQAGRERVCVCVHSCFGIGYKTWLWKVTHNFDLVRVLVQASTHHDPSKHATRESGRSTCARCWSERYSPDGRLPAAWLREVRARSKGR